ncbi:peroxisomal membrane anchor protein conserved region-domain-containing protein [Exophiala viscosa]|uniref:Peroxisomal membrane protein PEX14 n=1 Tax=Exophiala viscosa TaxID=2486360 RepID=A0AAN6DVD7_9EURO|nr:peroxisomal membrane anchor protein conserved region-domain-containing protein [Exophiala viscosa]
MAPDSKNIPSIPVWQRKPDDNAQQPILPSGPVSDTESTTSTDLPLLDQARKFLEDESIRDAPRERKVAYLETKGLNPEQIEQLLGSEPQSSPDSSSALKTVHDTTQDTKVEPQEAPASTSPTPAGSSQPQTATPKRDIPPIITYPEFLLKPQKPPPLVTFERLVDAAYVFAGVSALTYGASKYIVQPMLETLSQARHDLAESAIADLEQLNSKLESTVSHVPYIASSTILQRKPDDDLESIDSDPTELFHRDIATQTSPAHSGLSTPDENSAQDPTTSQSSRLRSLHVSLSSLVSSTNTHFSEDRLKEQVTEFQGVLDKLSASYNPFQLDYGGSALTSYTDDKSKSRKPASDNETAKFRAEIRALKGAFLSSRNFPTARPVAPYAQTGR